MIRVKMDHAGAAEILKSTAVQSDLKRRADRIARTAGASAVLFGNPLAATGFKVEVGVGRNRALASVTASSPAAMRAEAKNRVLTTALDAGR